MRKNNIKKTTMSVNQNIEADIKDDGIGESSDYNDSKFILKYVKLTPMAFAPVRFSDKAAGYDLTRYLWFLLILVVNFYVFFFFVL